MAQCRRRSTIESVCNDGRLPARTEGGPAAGPWHAGRLLDCAETVAYDTTLPCTTTQVRNRPGTRLPTHRRRQLDELRSLDNMATARLERRYRPSVPVEGGSANDYDYAEGDPINEFDLNGECAQLWRKRCRDRQAERVRDAAAATVGWVNENHWKLAGLAVSGVCIAGSGGAGTVACLAAGGALLTAKEVSTFSEGGSVGDHAYNVGSTALYVLAGSGWAAAGLKGAAGVGARSLSEVPNIACSSVKECASPGLPE